MADALSKMRALMKSLADVSETPHFGKVMFRVRNKPFASCGKDSVVVGLEPDHVDALIGSDPATFSRYARDTNALVIDTRKIAWAAVKDLVLESYRAVEARAPKRKTPPVSAKKPTAKKPAKKPAKR